jgi:hypothetical protein
MSAGWFRVHPRANAMTETMLSTTVAALQARAGRRFHRRGSPGAVVVVLMAADDSGSCHTLYGYHLDQYQRLRRKLGLELV